MEKPVFWGYGDFFVSIQQTKLACKGILIALAFPSFSFNSFEVVSDLSEAEIKYASQDVRAYNAGQLFFIKLSILPSDNSPPLSLLCFYNQITPSLRAN